jgi:hypothetical protein
MIESLIVNHDIREARRSLRGAGDVTLATRRTVMDRARLTKTLRSIRFRLRSFRSHLDAVGADLGSVGSDLGSVGSDTGSVGSDTGSVGADLDCVGSDLGCFRFRLGSVGFRLGVRAEAMCYVASIHPAASAANTAAPTTIR